MNQGNEMTIEQDNIYSLVKKHNDDAQDHSIAIDALERVLELEVKVFQLKKNLDDTRLSYFAFAIVVFIVECFR